MPNIRLHHDVSAACATALVEIVANCLREEERRDAWGMFYEAVKASLMQYDAHREMEAARLHPFAPSEN